MNDIYVKYSDLSDFSYYDIGAESRVYRSLDEKLILKMFNQRITYEQLENKKEKSLLLMNDQSLDEICVRPKHLVMSEQDAGDTYFQSIAFLMDVIAKKNPFMGIVMDYFDGQKLNNLPFSERVMALNIMKNSLSIFRKKGINYYDINFSNVLYKYVNDKLKVKFIDMDNIAYNDLPNDVDSISLQIYLSMGGKKDFKAVIYLFNLLSYSLLVLEESKLNEDEIDYRQAVKKICLHNFQPNNYNFSSFDETANNEFLIDYVNDSVKRRY